jgi:hypothetical protein
MNAAGEQVQQINLPFRGEEVASCPCPLDHLEVFSRRRGLLPSVTRRAIDIVPD